MNTLHFIFKSNCEILFDKEISYSKENDYYVFMLDEWIFRFCQKDTFIHFIKESKTDVFEIKKENNTVYSLITLKDENISFEVKILDFEYNFSEGKYIINYNIESDEDCLKTIILKVD